MDSGPAKNILLVGPPRVGKTTVMQKTLASLKLRCGGFYTQAEEKSYHTNFRIVTVEGPQRVISDTDLFHRMDLGLAFNQVDLEERGTKAVRAAIEKFKVVVIDQLGTFELSSAVFQRVVSEVLDSPRVLLATATTSDHEFLTRIKQRPDVAVYVVNEANRSMLATQLTRHIREFLDRHPEPKSPPLSAG